MNKFKLALATSALALASSGAIAATDGTLGATSTGTSIVTIIKEDAVQITNVNDLDFGTMPTMAADTTESDDVCVFSSTTGYAITVTSANGAFNLDSGTETLAYAVNVNGNAITYGTALTGQTGANDSLTCGGGTNGNFDVTIAAADFNAVGPGTYTDTLTLVVESE